MNTKNEDTFSVLISDERTDFKELASNSVIESFKPVVYILYLFGIFLVRYTQKTISRIQYTWKMYSVSILLLIMGLLSIVKPSSWMETKKDIPLNILTKSFSLIHTFEVLYSIASVSILKNNQFVNLFMALHSFDRHFFISRRGFLHDRAMGIIFVIFAVLQLTSTVFLRKFNVNNLGTYFTLFLIFLQASVIYFIVLNLVQRQKALNKVLENKVLIVRETKNNIKVCFKNTFRIKTKKSGHYCWFEIMEIYSGLADGFYYFNQIYGVQILLMFLIWFMCTLLIICRSLSPSLKYAELFLSDLFIYFNLNCRPFILAIMSEVMMREWRKTQNLIFHYMVQNNLDSAYLEQAQLMLDLVESRKIGINALEIHVNVATAMQVSGRCISYSVMMIQHFYDHNINLMNQ